MAEGHADLVLTGGAVYTVDAARSWAQAVAVAGGRIAAVGTDEQVSALSARIPRSSTCAGGCCCPGSPTPTCMPPAAGWNGSGATCPGSTASTGYLTAMRGYAERSPAAAWITGGGWAMDVFPGGVPGREDLDRSSPTARCTCPTATTTAAWVNSRALAIGRDGRQHPGPGRRPDRAGRPGAPSGTLHEGAMNLVRRAVPGPELAEQVAGICEGQRYLHALGITGWQEAIVGDYAVVPDCFDAYRETERQGLLTAQVTGALWWQRADRDRPARRSRGTPGRAARAGQPGGGRFRATSVKIMQDGVCENFTAAMLRPYLDGHGHETAGGGTSFFDAGGAEGGGHRDRRPRLPGALPCHRGPGGPGGARRGGGRPRRRMGPAGGGITSRICR